MKTSTSILFVVCLQSMAQGQTTIDLRTQSKSIDFSAASSTRPFKTGTTLPASCSIGDTYFKADAPVGQNLYGCTSTNTWSLMTGASAATFTFDEISGIASVAQGGTGASTTTQARTNLGAAAAVHTHALEDIGGVAGKNGTSSTLQAFGGGALDPNDCAKFDESGNLVSAGSDCGNATAMQGNSIAAGTPAAAGQFYGWDQATGRFSLFGFGNLVSTFGSTINVATGSVPQYSASPTMPASCAQYGLLHFDTDAPAGAKFSYCNGSTYEQVSGSGGADSSVLTVQDDAGSTIGSESTLQFVNDTYGTWALADAGPKMTVQFTPDTTKLAVKTAEQTFSEKVTFAKAINVSSPTSGTVGGDMRYNGGDLYFYNTGEVKVMTNPFTTQGDLLYQGPSGPARLAAGPAGLFLRGNGAGAAPSYAVPLASQIQNAFDLSTNNTLGANYATMTERLAPTNPSADNLHLYAKDVAGVSKLCSLDSAGTESCGLGGGIPTKLNDANGVTALDTVAVASAINHLTAKNATSGTSGAFILPTLGTAGSEANVGLALVPKGGGDVRMFAVIDGNNTHGMHFNKANTKVTAVSGNGVTRWEFSEYGGKFLSSFLSTSSLPALSIGSSSPSGGHPKEDTVMCRVATTDATATSLCTLALTNSQTAMIEARVVARRTGGTAGTAEDGGAYVVKCAFQQAGGVATQIGLTATQFEAENQDWNVACDADAGNARIRVTGAASNNITWHATTKLYRVGN